MIPTETIRKKYIYNIQEMGDSFFTKEREGLKIFLQNVKKHIYGQM